MKNKQKGTSSFGSGESSSASEEIHNLHTRKCEKVSRKMKEMKDKKYSLKRCSSEISKDEELGNRAKRKKHRKKTDEVVNSEFSDLSRSTNPDTDGKAENDFFSFDLFNPEIENRRKRHEEEVEVRKKRQRKLQKSDNMLLVDNSIEKTNSSSTMSQFTSEDFDIFRTPCKKKNSSSERNNSKIRHKNLGVDDSLDDFESSVKKLKTKRHKHSESVSKKKHLSLSVTNNNVSIIESSSSKSKKRNDKKRREKESENYKTDGSQVSLENESIAMIFKDFPSFILAQSLPISSPLKENEISSNKLKRRPKTKLTQRRKNSERPSNDDKFIDLSTDDEGILKEFGSDTQKIEDETFEEVESIFDGERDLFEEKKKDVSELKITWQLSPLHQLSTRPSEKQLDKLRAEGVVPVTGLFTKEENEILLRNWKEFQEEYNVVDFDSLKAENFRCEYPKKLKCNIIRYLGRGLENRTLRSIASKAAVFLSSKSTRFTAEDLLSMQRLIKIYGMNWLQISKIMDRNPDIVRIQARIFEKYNKTKWTKAEEEILQNHVMNGKTELEFGSPEWQAKIPWKSIGKSMNRSGDSCRQRWLLRSYIKFANWKVKSISTKENKLKLLRRLKALETEVFNFTHFLEISKDFPMHVSALHLQYIWYRMKYRIPNHQNYSTKDLIEIIERMLLPLENEGIHFDPF